MRIDRYQRERRRLLTDEAREYLDAFLCGLGVFGYIVALWYLF